MKALLSRVGTRAKPVCGARREREGVTVDFGDGFITKGTLCWGCLQKTVRVKSHTTMSDPSSNNQRLQLE